MAKKRKQGSLDSGIRLTLPCKEFNKVKKILENHILSIGGFFIDKAVSSAVKSTYTLGNKSKTMTWHLSPSQSSIHAAKKQVFEMLVEIGAIDKLGLTGFSNSNTRKKLRLKKAIDGNINFSKPVYEYPKEFKLLEKSIDDAMSKSTAEYEAEQENEKLDRMIRYYF